LCNEVECRVSQFTTQIATSFKLSNKDTLSKLYQILPDEPTKILLYSVASRDTVYYDTTINFGLGDTTVIKIAY
jgi:hypothetical protein